MTITLLDFNGARFARASVEAKTPPRAIVWWDWRTPGAEVSPRLFMRVGPSRSYREFHCGRLTRADVRLDSDRNRAQRADSPIVSECVIEAQGNGKIRVTPIEPD